MDMRYFTVSRIKGEYAYLKEDGGSEELFIAMALLPLGSDVGTRLAFDGLEFTVI